MGNGVTSSKTRGTWGWAKGVDEVETGRPLSAGLGLAPSLLVAGLPPSCTGTILGRRCPGAGGGHLPGYCTGHRPGRAQPSTRPSPPPRWQPSCAPAIASSSLPLLPSSSGEGRTGGWAGGWAGGFAALWLSASAAPAKQRRERAPRARCAPLPRGAGAAETRQTKALNDSAVGDCAARDAPRHCRFKHACPLFGIEPMSERPLPALSQ